MTAMVTLRFVNEASGPRLCATVVEDSVTEEVEIAARGWYPPADHPLLEETVWIVDREGEQSVPPPNWREVTWNGKGFYDERQYSLLTALMLEVADRLNKRRNRRQWEITLRVIGLPLDLISNPPRRPLPSWLHLVLERLEWWGEAVVEPVETKGLKGREGHDSDKSRTVPEEYLPFGQRRAARSLRLELPRVTENGKTTAGVPRNAFGFKDYLPAQLDERITLGNAGGKDLHLFLSARTPAEKRATEFTLWLSTEKDGPAQWQEEPSRRKLGHILNAEFARVDPRGGLRLLLEADRFGRVFLDLRDESGRRIAVKDQETGSPLSSVKKRGSDPRVYIANILVNGLYYDATLSDDRVEQRDLPGWLAELSCNGGPSETYHEDLNTRLRQGDGLGLALHIKSQAMMEAKNSIVRFRVAAEALENASTDEIVERLKRRLPPDMHDMEAFLTAVGNSMKVSPA